MHDDERDRTAAAAGRPALDDWSHRTGDIRLLRPGIDEHRAALAEQQVEKRFLEVRAARLPEDEEIGVVFVDSKHRRFRTRRARDPGGWKRAALDVLDGRWNRLKPR